MPSLLDLQTAFFFPFFFSFVQLFSDVLMKLLSNVHANFELNICIRYQPSTTLMSVGFTASVFFLNIYHYLLTPYYRTGLLILDHSYLVLESYTFKNRWYKSVRILEVLKLLFKQFLKLSSFHQDRSVPRLEDLSNNSMLGVFEGTACTDFWNVSLSAMIELSLFWSMHGWFCIRKWRKWFEYRVMLLISQGCTFLFHLRGCSFILVWFWISVESRHVTRQFNQPFSLTLSVQTSWIQIVCECCLCRFCCVWLRGPRSAA
jgi:hypothetical protein